MNDIPAILAAAAFAAERHSKQRRKDVDASPYINHPLALAHLLASVGNVRDPSVLQAALLHDTLEDTKTTYAELVEGFGEVVASIVAEVTDDKNLSKERRKELQVESAPTKSKAASLVKLADKTCNLRDMSTNPPAGWPLERRREYFDWSKRVVDALPPTNESLREAFDAAYAARP